MKIGAHVSTAGGISKSIARATEIGCEAIQIFGSSPQGWAFKPIPKPEIESFRSQATEAGIDSVFLHAIYLINLGTADEAHLDRGVQSLINYMNLAAEIGATGVVFHPGSHKGAGYEAILAQSVAAIQRMLENSPDGPYLAVENMAGMGQHIGAKFDELGRIIEGVNSPRLKVCLDTQHSFAAGYDLASTEGIESMISEFEDTIGVSNLLVVHANDSKRPCGSGVDRHDNIGDGFIGESGFATIIGHPAFRDVPFLLEVPGFNEKGPDQKNIDILKTLRQQAGIDSGIGS